MFLSKKNSISLILTLPIMLSYSVKCMENQMALSTDDSLSGEQIISEINRNYLASKPIGLITIKHSIKNILERIDLTHQSINKLEKTLKEATIKKPSLQEALDALEDDFRVNRKNLNLLREIISAKKIHFKLIKEGFAQNILGPQEFFEWIEDTLEYFEETESFLGSLKSRFESLNIKITKLLNMNFVEVAFYVLAGNIRSLLPSREEIEHEAIEWIRTIGRCSDESTKALEKLEITFKSGTKTAIAGREFKAKLMD